MKIAPSLFLASVLAAVLAPVLAPVAAEAQPAPNRVCQALEIRIGQSPAALEGRILNEALFEAATLDCPETAAGLLDKGASPLARNRFGATPLNTAAARGSREIAAMLLAQGADIEHRDLNGATPLLHAARSGRRRMVEMLLQAGSEVDAADKQGITPLMAAAFDGDLRTVNLLLAAGAQTELADIQGKTALFYAAGRAFPAIVEALLRAGASARTPGGNDLTALMWAAGHGNDAPAPDGLAVARMLVGAGAPVDAVDDRGRSALMIAASRGHAAMVAWLLEQGADPARRDKAGATARDLSTTPEVETLLGG